MVGYKKIIYLFAVIFFASCNVNNYNPNVKLYESDSMEVVFIDTMQLDSNQVDTTKIYITQIDTATEKQLDFDDILSEYDTSANYLTIDTFNNEIVLVSDTATVEDTTWNELLEIEDTDSIASVVAEADSIKADENKPSQNDTTLQAIYSELQKLREIIESKSNAPAKPEEQIAIQQDSLQHVAPVQYPKTQDTTHVAKSDYAVENKTEPQDSLQHIAPVQYPKIQDTTHVAKSDYVVENKPEPQANNMPPKTIIKRDTVYVMKEKIVYRDVNPTNQMPASNNNAAVVANNPTPAKSKTDTLVINQTVTHVYEQPPHANLNTGIVISPTPPEAKNDTVFITREVAVVDSSINKNQIDSLNQKYQRAITENTFLQDSIRVLKNNKPEPKEKIVIEPRIKYVNNYDTLKITALYSLNQVIPKNFPDIKVELNKVDTTQIKSVLLSGYTDISGSFFSNKKITARRIDKIKQLLMEYNVNEQEIFIQNFANKYASKKVIDAERKVNLRIILTKKQNSKR